VLPTQISGLINQGLRFLIIGGIIVFYKDLLSIEMVFCISVLSVWIAYAYILKKSKYLRSNSARIVSSYKKILINYLKLNWHTTIFYAFNGQVSIFLIGVFGSTSNLADLGALTRFSMLFIVLNALVTTL